MTQTLQSLKTLLKDQIEIINPYVTTINAGRVGIVQTEPLPGIWGTHCRTFHYPLVIDFGKQPLSNITFESECSLKMVHPALEDHPTIKSIQHDFGVRVTYDEDAAPKTIGYAHAVDTIGKHDITAFRQTSRFCTEREVIAGIGFALHYPPEKRTSIKSLRTLLMEHTKEEPTISPSEIVRHFCPGNRTRNAPVNILDDHIIPPAWIMILALEQNLLTWGKKYIEFSPRAYDMMATMDIPPDALVSETFTTTTPVQLDLF